MQELKSGEKIKLTNGSQATVIKELGRGGQGIVYLVELGGQKMALKWYIKAPDNAFYKNLDQNISEGAPSDAFLWPEYLTEKQKGSYGYIMKLRPDGYYEFGSYLLRKVRFKSFEATLNAAMKICDGFYNLHLRGYSYQDLNDGNFFIQPDSGDVLICDNDNVMPQGDVSGILGKARYMAPEVVTGDAKPDKYTDRFSLAVILFLLFYGNHPLEGKKVVARPCMTEEDEMKFYGSEALFIYDSENSDNIPVKEVHKNVVKFWPILPKLLRDTFTMQFGKECLRNPQKRLIEGGWKEIIEKLRDMLVICPVCGYESFVEDADSPKCMDCGKPFTLSGSLKNPSRRILLTPKTNIYFDRDNTPDAKVIEVPGAKYPVQLTNTTNAMWVGETPGGKCNSVEPNKSMPVKAGLKITAGQFKFEIF